MNNNNTYIGNAPKGISEKALKGNSDKLRKAPKIGHFIGNAPKGNYGNAPKGNYGNAPKGNYGNAPKGNYGNAPKGNSEKLIFNFSKKHIIFDMVSTLINTLRLKY